MLAVLAVGLLLASVHRVIAAHLIVYVPAASGDAVTVPSDVRERIVVERADARLVAWRLEPQRTPVRGTIFVLHGIRDSKLSSLASARRHVARGYRVVIGDSRGHGESTGPYLTYGVQESADLHALVDHLESNDQLARPLFVIGTSYGGATALQYAAGDSRVDKVVAISAFASMRELIPAYLHWTLGDFARFIPARSVNAAIRSAGNLAGFDPDRACARCVAAQVRASVLLIASRADERTPYQQSERLRDALGPRAELRLVERAHHVEVGSAPGVPEAIASWLDR